MRITPAKGDLLKLGSDGSVTWRDLKSWLRWLRWLRGLPAASCPVWEKWIVYYHFTKGTWGWFRNRKKLEIWEIRWRREECNTRIKSDCAACTTTRRNTVCTESYIIEQWPHRCIKSDKVGRSLASRSCDSMWRFHSMDLRQMIAEICWDLSWEMFVPSPAVFVKILCSEQQQFIAVLFEFLGSMAVVQHPGRSVLGRHGCAAVPNSSNHQTTWTFKASFVNYCIYSTCTCITV